MKKIITLIFLVCIISLLVAYNKETPSEPQEEIIEYPFKLDLQVKDLACDISPLALEEFYNIINLYEEKGVVLYTAEDIKSEDFNTIVSIVDDEDTIYDFKFNTANSVFTTEFNKNYGYTYLYPDPLRNLNFTALEDTASVLYTMADDKKIIKAVVGDENSLSYKDLTNFYDNIKYFLTTSKNLECLGPVTAAKKIGKELNLGTFQAQGIKNTSYQTHTYYDAYSFIDYTENTSYLVYLSHVNAVANNPLGSKDEFQYLFSVYRCDINNHYMLQGNGSISIFDGKINYYEAGAY